MSLNYRTFSVGPLQENCYLISDTESRGAVLIDPGEEAARLLAAVTEEGLNLKAIWLTHAHFDHVGALADILDVLTVPVFMHPADEPLLANAAKAAASWGISMRQPPLAYQALAANQELKLGQEHFQCLFTPGHAPGHISFYHPGEGLVFAGDALFKGSIGRTDLPLANHDQLIDSIKSQLLVLPGTTRILPGHFDSTTIAAEKQHNPFLH
jgi:glyoxylase-like metal-dependent hydrolase (beta-lactamase superfamily II)